MKIIDFRSDTVTKPTLEMRDTMYNTPVGDDVYMEDPTVNKLEKLAADIIGKEDALFVASGTMGNQIAIMCQTKLGDEIIVNKSSHIVKYEAGAAARLSGVNYAMVSNNTHRIARQDIEDNFRREDIHHPNTSLVCIENPLGADGTVLSIREMKEVYDISKKYNLSVHLDGARIFNAAAYLNNDVKDITSYTDTITFCLSKGLCSPVGSVLCGSKTFINKARKMRKLLGGGMRQAGILAACGIISLNKMIDRLHEDHRNAKYLAVKLNEIEGFNIDLEKIQTNMVFCSVTNEDFNFENFQEQLNLKGIKIGAYMDKSIRFVTHNDVDLSDIEYTLKTIKNILNQ